MRYHGNYCGPNWSAGKHQPSVVSDVPPIDDFDNTCLLHDASYARGDDLSRADAKFFIANFGRGLQRTAAAEVVGYQAALRAIDKFLPRIYKSKDEMTKNKKINNLRRDMEPPKMKRQVSKALVALPAPKAKVSQLTTVPAAFGYTLKLTAPEVKRNGNNAIVTGSDFASSVYASNSTVYEPAASVLLNPAFFNNAMLGSMARSYEQFRIREARIDYIPAVATSTTGQVVMTSVKSAKLPFISGSLSSFLSRALSSGNALAVPIWKEASLNCLIDSEWKNVDCLSDGDLDDAISQEVQVYALAGSAVTCGTLILHYVIEFKDPVYTYRSTLVPNPVGNGNIFSWQDDSAVNATTDNVRLSNTAISSTPNNGSIYRMVFIQGRSTVPTGPATWAEVAKVPTTLTITTTTNTTNNQNITMATGTVLYGAKVNSGNDVILFATLEDAIAGTINGSLLYQTATTAIGTWVFITTLVHLGKVDTIVAA